MKEVCVENTSKQQVTEVPATGESQKKGMAKVNQKPDHNIKLPQRNQGKSKGMGVH